MESQESLHTPYLLGYAGTMRFGKIAFGVAVTCLLSVSVALISRRTASTVPAKPPAPEQTLRLTSTRGLFARPEGGAAVRMDALRAELSPAGALDIELGEHRVQLDAQLPKARGLKTLDTVKGTATAQRGPAVERWSVEHGALEQSWSFATQPESSTLDVDIAVNGATVSIEERGVVLAAGNRALTVSHATWVDANGARSLIRAQSTANGFGYHVPEDVLAKTAWPAVLDPTIQVEQSISNDTTQVALVGRQVRPAVAVLANTALVVWEDDRRSVSLGVLDTDLFAATVNITNGTPNIVQKFALAVGPGAQAAPSIAAGGSNFLVAFQHSVPGKADADIYGALIPATDTVNRPTLIALATAATPEANPAVSYSPAEDKYLVVYDANASSGPIRALRVDANTGAPTSTFLISSGTNPPRLPRAGWSGSAYVIAWQEVPTAGGNASVGYSRLSQNSTTPSTPAFAGSGATGYKDAPEVVGGPGGEHLIAWPDLRNGFSTYDLYGITLNSAGTPSSSTGTLLRGGGTTREVRGAFMPVGATAYALNYAQFIGGVWRYTSTWHSPGTLALFGSPTVYGPSNPSGNGIGVNSNFKGLAAVSDGLDVLLAPIFSISVFTDGGVGIQPVPAAPGQELMRVTTSAGQALVSWTQWNGTGGHDIYGRRFNFDGGAIDANPLSLVVSALDPTALNASAGTGEHILEYHAVANNGTVDSLDVFTTRVTSTGVVGPTQTIASGNGTESVAGMVFDGTNHHALYYLHQFSGARAAISIGGRRVSPAGAIVDGSPYLVMSPGAALRNGTAAANNAGAVLVATEKNSLGNEELWTALVTGSTSNGGALFKTDAGFPTIASNGSEFLLVWESHGNATSPDLYGQRINGSGVVIDPSPVAIEVGSSSPERPNVTFNGGQYFVSWHERGADAGYDLRGRWLSSSLQPLNDMKLENSEDDVLPRAASDGQGRSLLAFVRLQEVGDFRVPRVFTTAVSAGRPADPCSTSTQCLSGFCVDGVCCDVACTNSCQTCVKAKGATADGTCGLKSQGSACRPADGGCDEVEVCDGVTAACPADGPRPANAICRPAVDGCDLAEVCDGTQFTCPPDAIADAGTVCTSSVLLCALPAVCNGSTVTCPATGTRPPDFICRPKDGGCDAEEKCDGNSQICPTDAFANSTVVCRSKSGDCDVEERCSGNNVECPPDTLLSSTQVCRAASATNECDATEMCSGSSVACGLDQAKPDGTSCSNGAGVCQSGACKVSEQSRYGWKGCGCNSGGPLMALLALIPLSRRRRNRWLAVAAALVVSLPAFAAERLKLVFTGVSAGTGVSEDRSKSVTEYVQSELSNIDAYKVVSPNDLAAILGIERQKQLLGCSDASSSCMTEVAGALDADRLLRGDLARIDETIVMNFSLIDLRKSETVGCVGRRIESGGMSAALREIQPMLYELLNQAPEHKGQPLVHDSGFQGLVVGLRGDADVLARGIAPGIFAELMGQYFGGALTVLATTTPGVRLEARFYPFSTKRIRVHLEAGPVVFTTGVGVRAGAGGALRFGHWFLTLDAAYERYLVDFTPGYSANAVILGLGVGWLF